MGKINTVNLASAQDEMKAMQSFNFQEDKLCNERTNNINHQNYYQQNYLSYSLFLYESRGEWGEK